jgi:hypothetical protein
MWSTGRKEYRVPLEMSRRQELLAMLSWSRDDKTIDNQSKYQNETKKLRNKKIKLK